MHLSLVADLDGQPFAERIDNAGADAVQAA